MITNDFLVNNLLEIDKRLADESDYESNLRPKMKEILDFLVETALNLEMVNDEPKQ